MKLLVQKHLQVFILFKLILRVTITIVIKCKGVMNMKTILICM